MPSTLSIDHISYCRFLTDISQTWTQDHWRARDIVRAIKGEDFEGYVTLRVGNAVQILDKAHPEVAFDWFVDRVAIETTFAQEAYSLCPIPDSQCTSSCGRPSKTMRLAGILSARLPFLKIWDGLRFEHEMPKSRISGMRDEEVLFQAMELTSSLPSGKIILLDDVCTTGAHARAAARFIKQNGAEAMVSMSVARTMLDPLETVF